MNDQPTEPQHQPASGSADTPLHANRRRFPLKTLAFTLMAVAVAAVLKLGHEPLNEAFNLNPGFPNAISMALALLVVLAWGAWFVFFSGWAWVTRLGAVAVVGGLPLLGVILFQPVFDGDISIVRWESRFGSHGQQFVPADEVSTSPVVDPVWLESTPFDFPQFLGPSRDATINNVSLAGDWQADSPEIEWKIPVGEGWSGFVVVGQLAYTQQQLADHECVTCYRLSNGEQVWQYAVPRRHEDLSAMGRVGPRATPTVFGGRVFVTSGTGVLDCLAAETGELIWSADVPGQVGIEQVVRTNSRGLQYTQENSTLTWGRSASPLIVDDVVVVPGGGPETGDKVTLLAFDIDSGKERWRGGQRAASYGSPSLLTVLGQKQIVLVVENAAVGHDPKTGEELWAHPWPGNSNSDASCSQITPIDDSTLLLSKGYGVGAQVIRVGQTDGQWKTESLKANRRVVRTKFTNPVILGEFAYSLSDGFLECTQLPNLKRKWKKRGRFGNGQLLLVGDKLLVHSEHGTLYLIDASPEEYRQLGKFRTINGVCWNTLCLSNDLLLVRSELEAALVRLPLTSKSEPNSTADSL